MLAVLLSFLFLTGGAYGSPAVYQYFENVLNALRLSKDVSTDLGEVKMDDFASEFEENVTALIKVKVKVEFKDGYAIGLTRPKRVVTCHPPYYGTAGRFLSCTVAFDNLNVEYRGCEVTYADMPKVAFKTAARVSRMVFSVEVSKEADKAAAVTSVEGAGQDFMAVRFEGLGPLNVFARKMMEGFRNGIKGEPLAKVTAALKTALEKVVAVTPFPAE